MNETQDGGPAFPTHCEEGMTLRDYFAAMAMQGLLANHELISLTQKEIAKKSVRQAEELIKALRA